MKGINPNIQVKRNKGFNLDKLKQEIEAGNKSALSQGITLTESTKTTHKELGNALLQWAVSKRPESIRVGITGVPGAGKSTFIESFGLYLIGQGYKVAVLAIDPSSQKTKGSILGDKTRMENLAKSDKSFIRPTASGSSLGGIAGSTREAMVLCEAAGYNVILIETVGVGQSETSVKNMVDFFLLLLVAGAGDELQGMKRGIMEMANLILINKAEGENKPRAIASKLEYARAVSLFPLDSSQFKTKVSTCSALENIGMENTWTLILEFLSLVKSNGFYQENRKNQAINWLDKTLEKGLLDIFTKDETINNALEQIKNDVKSGNSDPMAASFKLLKHLEVKYNATET